MGTTQDKNAGARKLYVTFLLDASGSMEIIREQAINHFNEQVQTLNAEKGTIETRVGLVVFASEPRWVLFDVPVDDFPELDKDGYTPDGMTAFRDAIGVGVNRIKKEIADWNDEAVSHLVVAVTDGQENNSKEFSPDQIVALIKECQASGRWTFTVMGANIDMDGLVQEYGIPKGNTMAFCANAAGTAHGTLMTSRGISAYYGAMSSSGSSGSLSTFARKDFFSAVCDDGKSTDA